MILQSTVSRVHPPFDIDRQSEFNDRGITSFQNLYHERKEREREREAASQEYQIKIIFLDIGYGPLSDHYISIVFDVIIGILRSEILRHYVMQILRDK